MRNNNSQIRCFLPIKFDLARLTNQDIERSILLLNLTPRKVLGGITLLEGFTGRRVALIP
jgi:IS30 family transposase